jgi:hypothetical protein
MMAPYTQCRDEIAAEARAWESVFQEFLNLQEEAKGGIDA